MMKRLMDIVFSTIGLLLFSPLFLVVMFLVWLQDKHSPFYVALRVGRGGRPFKMIKMRSMVIGADKSGVSSTSNTDERITAIGHFIRRYKVDELTQLWNVLLGDMSLVGPRPQVESGVAVYSSEEMQLLHVKPGITDFASIVFSDEGKILENEVDPDTAYNFLIRPGKSLLGLFYVKNRTLWVDIQLCFVTIFSVFSRDIALRLINNILTSMGADEVLLKIAARNSPLGSCMAAHSLNMTEFDRL